MKQNLSVLTASRELGLEAAESVEKELGPAAILVNNASIIRRTPPDAETFAADWDQVMTVNATGVMQVTRAFLRHEIYPAD